MKKCNTKRQKVDAHVVREETLLGSDPGLQLQDEEKCNGVISSGQIRGIVIPPNSATNKLPTCTFILPVS